MKTVTDKTIDSAKPKAPRYSIHDNRYEGLQAVIYPTGVKSWVWRGKVQGKVQKHTFGRYPSMSLAEARDRAADLLRLRNGGIDPRAAAQVARVKSGVTLDSVFELYMKREGERLRSSRQIRRYYQRDVSPRLGTKIINQITYEDLDDILLEKFRVAPTASERLRSLLARLFRWSSSDARRETYLTANPARDLVKRHRPLSRDRVLDDFELGLLLRSVDVADERFAIAIRLLVLTGARRQEVLSASWGEFDLEAGEWLIPGTRTKNGKPLLLPLGPLAVGLIKSIPRLNSSDLLFPSSRASSNAPFSGVSKSIDQVRGRMLELAQEQGRVASHWRIHDLRRSFVTGMSALQNPSVAPHVVEALVNHVSGAKAGVAGVYNRHQYYSEKKIALKAWESHIFHFKNANRSSFKYKYIYTRTRMFSCLLLLKRLYLDLKFRELLCMRFGVKATS